MAQSGYGVTFDQLFQHSRWVRELSRTLVGDEAAADDVAQLTWLSAMRRRPDDAGSARAWLRQVVTRSAKDLRRANARRETRERAVASREGLPSTAEIVAQEELRRHVIQAVLALSEVYRGVLLLRFFKELSSRQIAQELDIPVETVRTRIKRGLAMLRADLDQRIGSDRSTWCAALVGHFADGGVRGGALAVLTTSSVWMWIVVAVLGVSGSWAFVRNGSGQASSSESVPAEASLLAPSEMTGPAPRTPVRVRRPLAAERAAGPEKSFAFGVVLDPDGEPAVGARVRLFPSSMDPYEPVDRAKILGECETRDDGWFQIAEDARSARYLLVATLDGSFPAIATVRPGEPTTLQFNESQALYGTVTEFGNGRPVEGALVRWTAFIDQWTIVVEAHSDVDGDYVIEGILSQSSWDADVHSDLWIEAPGFQSQLLECDWGGPRPERDSDGDYRFDLMVDRGFRIEGVVCDAVSREPLAGASVELIVCGASTRPGDAKDPSFWRVETDQQGRFEGSCPGLGYHCSRAGRVALLSASAPGHVRNRMEVRAQAEGAVWKVELRCPPTASVRGRVVAEDGRPRAGVSVWAMLEGAGGAYSGRVQTDAQGMYRLAEVPSGDAPLGVYANLPEEDGLAPGRNGMYMVKVDTQAGAELVAPDIEVPLPHRIALEVVDSHGSPVPAATVAIDLQGLPFDRGSTDREGRVCFAVPRLRSQVVFPDVHVLVDAEGFVRKWTPALTPEIQPQEQRIELVRGCVLSGRVVDGAGQPVRGARLLATTAAISVERAFDKDRHRSRPDRPPASSAISDEEGHFRLKQLTAGPWHVLADGGDCGRTVLDRVNPRTLNIVLPGTQKPEPGSVRLHGRVLGEDGAAPIVGAQLRLISDGGERFSATNAVGEFSFEGVSIGTHKLSVTAEGHGARTRLVEIVEVAEGDGPAAIEIELSRGVTVRGTVHRSKDFFTDDHKTLPYYTIHLVSEDGSRGPFAGIGAEGSYSIAGVSPGRYRVTFYNHFIDTTGWVIAATEPRLVDIPKGRDIVDLDLTAAPATRVSLGVRRDGAPRTVAVELRRSGSLEAFVTLSAEKAKYPFSLAAGSYEARRAGDEQGAWQRFEVDGTGVYAVWLDAEER